MPSYQLLLVLPKAEGSALKMMLKRSAQYIFDVGGVLKKMENLGCQQTPYLIHANGKKHGEANFFTMDFYANIDGKKALKEKFSRDVEVVRTRIFQEPDPHSLKKAEPYECDLYIDMLPPVERPSVQEMEKVLTMKQKRARKGQFQFNTGLDYCPF